MPHERSPSRHSSKHSRPADDDRRSRSTEKKKVDSKRCPECQRPFTQHTSMTRHLITQHGIDEDGKKVSQEEIDRQRRRYEKSYVKSSDRRTHSPAPSAALGAPPPDAPKDDRPLPDNTAAVAGSSTLAGDQPAVEDDLLSSDAIILGDAMLNPGTPTLWHASSRWYKCQADSKQFLKHRVPRRQLVVVASNANCCWASTCHRCERRRCRHPSHRRRIVR